MRSTRNVDDTDPEAEPPSEDGAEIGHYSDPPLLVLASLASGPRHGHAMIEDIASMCGTRLGPGTLYGAIARLEQLSWIEPLPAEQRRRPYRITSAGLRVLRARLATLHQFTQAGLGRLEGLPKNSPCLTARIQRLLKNPSCLRARIYPCHKCRICNAALAAEVRFPLLRQLFQRRVEAL